MDIGAAIGAGVGLTMILGGMFLFAVLAFYVILTLPVLPYAIARITGKDALVVLGRNGRMRVIPAKYRYLESTKWAAWLPKNPKFYNWAGVQTAVVYDGWGVILDPEMLTAIEELEKLGFKDYDDLKSYFDRLNAARENLRILEPVLPHAELLIAHQVYSKDDLEDMDNRGIPEEIQVELKQAYNVIEEFTSKLSTDERAITVQHILSKVAEAKQLMSLEKVVAKAFTVIDMHEIEKYLSPLYPSELKAEVEEAIAEAVEDYRGNMVKIASYVVLAVVVIIGGAVGFSIVMGVLGGG